MQMLTVCSEIFSVYSSNELNLGWESGVSLPHVHTSVHMSCVYEMQLVYLFSVTYLSVQFSMRQYAAYTSLYWGSFFFLNHCHLWQANHQVHFQTVTGDSTSFLTQLPMLSMLPVLSSWLWLFQGKMWAMNYWMLFWRGMLAFWNFSAIYNT